MSIATHKDLDETVSFPKTDVGIPEPSGGFNLESKLSTRQQLFAEVFQ